MEMWVMRRMALLVPIVVAVAVAAATPLCLLELVATFLRLAAVLTVAVNCLSEIFLGLVDTLVAIGGRYRPPACAPPHQPATILLRREQIECSSNDLPHAT